MEEDIVLMSRKELDYNIVRFVQEAGKRDGKDPYPPNSLYQITVSLQCHLRESGCPEISFFCRAEPRFFFSILCHSLGVRGNS